MTSTLSIILGRFPPMLGVDVGISINKQDGDGSWFENWQNRLSRGKGMEDASVGSVSEWGRDQ